MAFQYPESKFEYLRDLAKGTPFAALHRAMTKTLGVRTALLIAELEWGFSRHEHSTAKNAHYGMPRYIMTPKTKDRYVPVLADNCDYTSARAFKSQFAPVGEYYSTLAEYFEKVESGEDPFNKKPYLCIYNRKKHYARFMRNQTYATKFFFDRLNGKPLPAIIEKSVLASKLKSSSINELHLPHELLFDGSCNTYNNIISLQSNTTINTIEFTLSIKEEEVLADNFVVCAYPTPNNTEQVGQGKIETESVHFTNGDTVTTMGTSGCLPGFEGNCTDSENEITCKDAGVIADKKPWSKSPKSASKMGASLSSVDVQSCFETKTPHPALATSAYSFNSAKQAPTLNASAVYSVWSNATLHYYPETLLKPPTGKDFGVCKKIISNAREYFDDDDIFALLKSCIKAWEKGIIQGILKTDTVLFTFPTRLELTFLLKYQTHFMTWYQCNLEMEAKIHKNNAQKKLAKINGNKAVTANGSVVVKSPLPKEESYIEAVNSVGVTYPSNVLHVYPSTAEKETMEFRLARAELDASPSGVGSAQLIKEYLAKHAVDLAASLAKAEDYKVTYAKEL